MPSRLLLAPAIAALVAAPAATAGGPGSPPATPAVTIVTAEYGFTLPASVAAGPTVLRLSNHGKTVHHVTLIRLENGKRVADLVAVLSKPGPPPTWAVPVGGPNAVGPGGTASAVVDLHPGRYALLCFVPDPDGKPHFMKGMARELLVTGVAPKAAPPTRPEMTVQLADYGFTYPGELTAGEHHLRVHNAATQPHELVLFRLAPGKTTKDFVAWAQGGMKTMPPGSFEGGASTMAPGMDNDILVNLRAGHYLMVCFVDDARDGKPHLVHGMMREVTIN